jgi:hypothetical protein
MLHMFLEKGPWFRPKKYGYGASLPFKWQGWALLVAHMALIMGVAFILDGVDCGAAHTAARICANADLCRPHRGWLEIAQRRRRLNLLGAWQAAETACHPHLT